jgi:hypothetical protein
MGIALEAEVRITKPGKSRGPRTDRRKSRKARFVRSGWDNRRDEKALWREADVRPHGERRGGFGRAIKRT